MREREPGGPARGDSDPQIGGTMRVIAEEGATFARGV